MKKALGGSRFRNFVKKESRKKAFQDMLHGLGEVNPFHAYYNGSCTSKDNEDPSWSISLVPQRQKASYYDNSGPDPQLQNVSPSADTTVPSQQELDLLFGPLYDEFFNAEPSTPTYVNDEENNNDQAEFTNPFYTPTKDHPLTQIHGNLSKPVQTRRQLTTNPEMCMFALTVSTAEPKNIKETMADSAWIEAMQKELHQFDRPQVWELVDKPFGKNVIKLKRLWKNKKDEDQTVIRNKA
ncbi:hypothetical protein Tco_1099301 [Tanacetum coccineum]